MRFWLRWIADGVAVFLSLYLLDTLLHGRFHFSATWPVVLAAVVLGFLDSFFKPLHRMRSRPPRAILVAVATILVNALILQLFVWVGAGLTTSGFPWVLGAAAFVVVVTGLINSQVGFSQPGKPRPAGGPRPVQTDRKRPN